MRIFQMILLALGVAMVGAAGVGADYILQKEKADGAYDHRTYVNGLFDRLGNTGGYLGLIFRDLTKIDLAMPEPPAGWEAWYINDEHLAAGFCDDQRRVREREIGKVRAQVPAAARLSTADQALYDAYVEDTYTAYTHEDHVILLFVHDADHAVNQPVLANAVDISMAHFAAISTKRDWRAINGQMWQEVEDPVTRTENGLRPHRLRMFETSFGSVTMQIEARASEDAMVQFLEDFDLSGLQRLSEAGGPVVSAQLSDAGLDAQTTSLRPQLRPADLQKP